MPSKIRDNQGFNCATVAQMALIPAVTGLIIMIGNYYTTGDTINRHSKEIETLQSINQKDKKEENDAREKVRSEYLNYQQKTNEILSKLDTRLAVSETKQETANQTLNKIADTLSKISASSSLK